MMMGNISFTQLRLKIARSTGFLWGFYMLCSELLKEHNILIAGTIGSGKSVLLNSLLCEMLKSDPGVHAFLGVDLKHGCELGIYEDTPNCIGLSTDPEYTIYCLREIESRMEKRYQWMKENGLRKYPYGKIWVVMDEMADLTTNRDIVRQIVRLMRLGRAARVGVIGCTQSPNRSKGGGLTPEIQQNFTCCVGLRCRSAIESRQIIGLKGCETLPEYGYCYVWDSHGIRKEAVPFTPDEEIERTVNFYVNKAKKK